MALFFAELRQSGDIAHSAHLGGMLGSFLSFLFLSQRKDFPVVSFSFLGHRLMIAKYLHLAPRLLPKVTK